MHTPPALFPLSGKFLVWLICIVRVFWRVIFWVDRSADVMYLDSQRMHCWWSHLNFRSVLLDICELPRKLLNKYANCCEGTYIFSGSRTGAKTSFAYRSIQECACDNLIPKRTIYDTHIKRYGEELLAKCERRHWCFVFEERGRGNCHIYMLENKWR